MPLAPTIVTRLKTRRHALLSSRDELYGIPSYAAQAIDTIPLMGIKKIAIALSLFATLGLAACAPAAVTPNEGSNSAQAPAVRGLDAILDDLDIDQSNPRALIDALDAMPVADRPSDLIASVQPTAVTLQPGEPDEVTLPFDGEDFYVSMAPYVSQTHPCTFHSLTTCLGEQQNTPITLTVTDTTSGEVIIAESTSTADNGFVGIWLPRDGEFLVQIDAEGGSAGQVVKTGSEDPTCITTLQLT